MKKHLTGIRAWRHSVVIAIRGYGLAMSFHWPFPWEVGRFTVRTKP